MTSSLTCCNCCNHEQNDDVAQQLTKRLDEMEQRLNQMYKLFDLGGKDWIYSHAETSGTDPSESCRDVKDTETIEATEEDNDDDNNSNSAEDSPPLNFFRSRRLVGLSGNQPRYTFSLPPAYRKTLNIPIGAPSASDSDEENEAQQLPSFNESPVITDGKGSQIPLREWKHREK